MHRWCRSVVLMLLALAPAAPVLAQGALVNARIHTMDPAQPLANLLVWDRDGRIIAIGTETSAPTLRIDGPAIDGGGRAVVPGLIDAHAHMAGLGQSLMRADLVGTRSKDEVLQRLREFEDTLPDGAWLLGRGWDQNHWPEPVFPTAADLDAAFPSRPVWLERIDGHAGWANSVALMAADRRLDGDWQPDGGRILRDPTGQPTGVLVDEAMKLVEVRIPPASPQVRREALQRALQLAVSHGLTGVHDMGVALHELGDYRILADQGELPLRITALADGDHAAFDALCAMGPYAHPGGRLRMRGVKLYIDGALGSRGAALLDDYSDEPGHRGLLVTAPQAFEASLRKARDCGVQVATHAIGDRGNREVLDAYARVLGNEGARLRWRIEHAQVLASDDIPRFAALGVIASMQPTHATSDMPWVPARLGAQREQGAYAWQRLLRTGAKLALGSDFPVEPVDPMLGLHAAATRQDERGLPPGGWHPEQRLSPYEALRGFTVDAAYAGFAEAEVGMLQVGKRADFVLLELDPLAIAPSLLRNVRVHSTFVDGRAVYVREEAEAPPLPPRGDAPGAVPSDDGGGGAAPADGAPR